MTLERQWCVSRNATLCNKSKQKRKNLVPRMRTETHESFPFFKTKHLCAPQSLPWICALPLSISRMLNITTVYTRVGRNMWLKTAYILSKDLKHDCVCFSSKKITIHANIANLNKLFNYCKYHSSIKSKRFLWDLRQQKHTFLFPLSTYYNHNITPCETGVLNDSTSTVSRTKPLPAASSPRKFLNLF